MKHKVQIRLKKGHLYQTVTSSKAPLLSPQNLRCRQRLIVNLHTRDTSPEVTSITYPGSHPNRIICCQSYTPDTFTCDKPPAYKELSSFLPKVIGCSHVLPLATQNSPAEYCCSETPSASASETYKQRSTRCHPEVNAPAIGHIIEDGTRASLMIYPCQEGNGTFSIQSSLIGKLNVAA